MIKKLIPHYFIDEENLEKEIIKDNLGFSVSPYLEELPEQSQKIFNTFFNNEKVWTERMMDDAIELLNLTGNIIIKRKTAIDLEIDKLSPNDLNKPQHPYYFLQENYKQQLYGIHKLKEIFTK